MLEEVDMSDNVYSIGVSAFASCDSLLRIEIPEGVERIKEGCFNACESLYEVILPESVYVIEESAFSYCSALKEINIPAGVTSIYDYAFSGCTSLESIVLPKKLSTIYRNCFGGCMALKYIVIPEKVATIERNAFSSCKRLEWVVIPVSVKAIEPDAFANCSGIKEFRYCGDETQWQSVKTYSNINAPVVYNYSSESCGHSWSDWMVITEPTGEAEGVEKRICSNCGTEETRTIAPIKPVVAVDNYTVSITYSDYITAMRYASGEHTTAGSIKNAPDRVDLSASVIAKNTVDGDFVYEMPDGGQYTFWVRMSDGTEYLLSADMTKFTPTVDTYGVKITVNNLYDIKDCFIAKGEFDSYNEIKNNGYIVRLTANKIAGKHSYTYTVTEPGMHTVLVRYNDGSEYIFHEELTVDEPVFTTNGLQVTISNIPDVKVIRTAYGEYYTPGDTKRAEGARNFSNKSVIKNAEEYMLQYREEGRVTIIVEYNNGYVKVFHYDVTKKTPTMDQDGSTVTFGNLDGLVMVRYAEGIYATSSEIKKATGSKVIKPDAIADGKITVTDLAVGTYTFCVQYDDDSYNYYVVTVA